MTLRPSVPTGGGLVQKVLDWLAAWPPTAGIGFPTWEFAANVVLFTPLGALVILWLGPRHMSTALALGFAVSIAIEVIQGTWLAGRVSDPRDIVSNSTGAVLGALAVTAIRWRTRRQVTADTYPSP